MSEGDGRSARAAGNGGVVGAEARGASPVPPRSPVVLPPNAFGIAFGLAGLAQCWSAARDLVGAPREVADALWLLTALVYVVILVGYLGNLRSTRRGLADVTDPVLGPFTALVFIVPMLLGLALAHHVRSWGEIVFMIALAATAIYGGWLSGQWIVRPLTLAQWHPGYFLPTVAGGLIAAGGAAALGHPGLAKLMFGYGAVCWMVLGSIMLTRLFTQPPLPVPLLPTIAIEVAPPVVAGNAWFLINGGQADTIAWALAGYGLLMVLVQLRLTTLFTRVPFGLGWWAFSFSYAAAFTVAVRWLAAEQVAGQRLLTYLLLAVLTAALGALVAGTLVKLGRGTLLPRPAAPAGSTVRNDRATSVPAQIGAVALEERTQS